MHLKSIALAVLAALFVTPARSETSCLLIAEASSGVVLHQEGEGCAERIGPASSFKFALSLMGFDAGILTGGDAPALPYKAEYRASRAADKQTVTPEIWLRESVLWYSRELVAAMGAERFARYVSDFGYGNADVSGDPGANNGLTHSWLNSSLQISPAEQLDFIRRFLNGELPVSTEAMMETAAITPTFYADAGWALRGKTGTGYIKEANGERGKRQFGWFVGWGAKYGGALAFVHLTRNSKAGGSAAGPKARDELIARWDALVD